MQEVSLQCQLKCDAVLKQIEDGTLSAGERKKFEQEIIELLLTLFNESKYLKERISQITHEPADLQQVELYGKFYRIFLIFSAEMRCLYISPLLS